MSGSHLDREGYPVLYYPEYDAPATNDGRASHVNSEDAYHLFGRFSLQDLTLEAAFAHLGRQVPTAPFGERFNDPRNRTWGYGALVKLEYRHLFAEQWQVNGRLLYSQLHSRGDYAYDYGEPGSPLLVVNRDDFRGAWWGAELQVSRLFFDRHRMVAGGEFRDNFRQDLKNADLQTYLDTREDSQTVGLFLQDDYQVFRQLALSLGLRYDYFSTFGGTTSPRLALIYTPGPKTACKLLFGRAFRAPSAFENYYHDGYATQKPNPDLGPETIRTWELVWEQYFGDHLRAVANGFYYEIDDLINLTLDPADGLLVFRNLDEAKAKGLELELEGRFGGGWEGRISYSAQLAQDRRTGEQLSNSPRQMIKLNLAVPLWRERLTLALEEQYYGSRRTVADATTGGFALTNTILYGRELLPGVEFSLAIYNLLDKRYSQPVSAAYRQDTIAQDGRTYRAKLTCSF